MSISTMSVQPMALELALPWHEDQESARRYRRVLWLILIPFMLLFLLVPRLEVFETPYKPLETVTDTTKLILDPSKPVEKIKSVANPKIAAPKKVTKTPILEGKTEITKKMGLSELSSQLKPLRDSLDVAKMKNKNASTNTGGSIAAVTPSILSVESTTRKNIGIEINEEIMKNDDIDLAKHYSTEVEAVFDEDALIVNSQYSNLPNQSVHRDMESIRRALEQAKSRIYSLYQQALLENPNLEGNFTFSIVIEPNGSISNLELVESELGIQDVENKILAHIKQVNFGFKAVSATRVKYNFLFLQS